MKLSTEDEAWLEVRNKIWKWVNNLIKKSLIVKQCTMKNI